MKKKIGFVLFTCVTIVLSYFYANIDKNSYLYNRDAETETYVATGVLMQDELLMQSFIAEDDTLDGINMKLSLLGNADEVLLHYVILDADTKELAAATISGAELENNKFNFLKIPQIKDAKGKQFTLVLAEQNADEQNGISFYLDPTPNEEHTLTIKGNDTVGSLVTRTVCHRFDVETFVVLLGMITFIAVFMRALYKLFK